jgi:hypothetical protein
MLCEDLEVNGVIREHGLDAKAVTDAYRKAIVEGLRKLKPEGYVAERKATRESPFLPFSENLLLLSPRVDWLFR